MDRRTAIAAAAFGLITVRLLAFAQQPQNVFRVGIPTSGINPRSASFMRAFEQRLHELGWVEGANLAIEYREARSPEEVPVLVAELVRKKVDLLFASGTDHIMAAAVEATRSIPIVMIALNYDPVERGYIKSLAHPGSNVTGVFARNPEVGAKQLELLKQAFPNATRVGVLWDIFSSEQLPSIKTTAARLRVELESVEVRPPYDFEVAFSRLRDRQVSAILVVGSPVSYRERERIAQLAIRERLPVVGGPSGAQAGNLISFGFDLNEVFRRAADYVDRILKGASPADLPVEQPTRFELIINLKTAKALGLTIPQDLRLRADEVIE
jgi:putative ABC transport system substrate-binding protein